jgi:hypothetical protein
VPGPAAPYLLLAKPPANYAVPLFLYRGPDLLCRIPVLRCVLWDLRRGLLRGNARCWERAVPVDPASEVHGSRNRQETSNRAYEQCIILESQQWVDSLFQVALQAEDIDYSFEEAKAARKSSIPF